MDARVARAESTGKEVLTSLPDRADAAEALLAARFPTSPSDFRVAASAAFAPRKSNADLVATQDAVHALLVTGVADMRALEFWLATRVPAVSDGGNFGVEVLMFVLEQLKGFRLALAGHADGMASYLAARGAAIEKLGGSRTTETTATESTETKVEEGKPKDSSTKKTDTTEKSSTKEDVEDLVRHVVELDVKHYIALEGMVRDLAQTYVKAHALIEKNKEKCENPRGAEEGGGRMNTMY